MILPLTLQYVHAYKICKHNQHQAFMHRVFSPREEKWENKFASQIAIVTFQVIESSNLPTFSIQ